jgi:hypothetical protein
VYSSSICTDSGCAYEPHVGAVQTTVHGTSTDALMFVAMLMATVSITVAEKEDPTDSTSKCENEGLSAAHGFEEAQSRLIPYAFIFL